MEQQRLEPETTGGAEWFAAWLPKPAPVSTEPEGPSFVEEVRAELKAITEHLRDPSAAGVRAAIPHLERAIALFGKHALSPESASAQRPSLDGLRDELALANRLFENAYALQATWAMHLGLNMDGSPRQLLYGRHGEPVAGEIPAYPPETWEG